MFRSPGVMKRVLGSIMVAMLCVVVAAGCRGGAASGDGGDADTSANDIELRDYPLGGDFTLTSHMGTSFKLSDERGKVVFLFFGYTTCPDVCPLTMSKIAEAVKKVQGAKDQMTVLFVSVDVDRDTPDALARYVKAFDMPVIGLTGTKAQIDAVVEQYRSAYEITPSTSAAGPEVSHTSYTYLIDRAGKVRALVSADGTADRMALLLRLMLKS